MMIHACTLCKTLRHIVWQNWCIVMTWPVGRWFYIIRLHNTWVFLYFNFTYKMLDFQPLHNFFMLDIITLDIPSQKYIFNVKPRNYISDPCFMSPCLLPNKSGGENQLVRTEERWYRLELCLICYCSSDVYRILWIRIGSNQKILNTEKTLKYHKKKSCFILL